jgi:UDP-N-acetylmuramate dehydrogenase
MMPALRQSGHLIDRLPRVRGTLRAEAPIARLTWFRVGGPAEVLFSPADLEDLATFLSAKPADVPVTVIGVGSNLLVRDGGIAGVVVHLGKAFARVQIDGTDVHAGAGMADVAVAAAARDAGLAGLEFLSGVPGTIGGALRMNAGAYGREIKDVTIQAEALDDKGRLHSLGLDSLGFAYRHTAVPEGWIFTAAVLAGTPSDKAAVARRMAEIRDAREESQPLRTRTGGSTFQNPPNEKAWELIDRAGCRGLTRGGAQVSEKHCNFLINTGTATAADIEGLGEEVRRRVREATGIELVWEIRRIGRAVVAAPNSSEGGG